MANTSAPYGLRAVANAYGAPYSAGTRVYSTATGDGTALYLGAPVLAAGTGQTIDARTYIDVGIAATTDVITGVVDSVKPITRSSTIYREASTQRLVNIVDDPNALFMIQESGSGTALSINDTGFNVSFAGSGGSTVTGWSAIYVDNATEATTNTLALKLITPVSRADNAPGAVAQDWLVRINRHRFVDQIAGV
jgi:hypothetical protein